MPLIYYRASLMGTAEGEDAISFISSDTNKQPSLSNRSRSPSVRQVNSEGMNSQQITSEVQVFNNAIYKRVGDKYHGQELFQHQDFRLTLIF